MVCWDIENIEMNTNGMVIKKCASNVDSGGRCVKMSHLTFILYSWKFQPLRLFELAHITIILYGRQWNDFATRSWSFITLPILTVDSASATMYEWKLEPIGHGHIDNGKRYSLRLTSIRMKMVGGVDLISNSPSVEINLQFLIDESTGIQTLND